MMKIWLNDKDFRLVIPSAPPCPPGVEILDDVTDANVDDLHRQHQITSDDNGEEESMDRRLWGMSEEDLRYSWYCKIPSILIGLRRVLRALDGFPPANVQPAGEEIQNRSTDRPGSDSSIRIQILAKLEERLSCNETVCKLVEGLMGSGSSLENRSSSDATSSDQAKGDGNPFADNVEDKIHVVENDVMGNCQHGHNEMAHMTEEICQELRQLLDALYSHHLQCYKDHVASSINPDEPVTLNSSHNRPHVPTPNSSTNRQPLQLLADVSAKLQTPTGDENDNTKAMLDAAYVLCERVECYLVFLERLEGSIARHPQWFDQPQLMDHSIIMAKSKVVRKSLQDSISHGAPTFEEYLCFMCLGPVEEDDRVRILDDCNHYFHKECIDFSLKLRPTCPICDNDLSNPNRAPTGRGQIVRLRLGFPDLVA